MKLQRINDVFETTEYSAFKTLDGNRNLNPANLARLKKSMQEELLQVPIIVNEKMEIIDGQHRFESCKDLGLPLCFIIVKGYELPQVHKLNAIARNWSLHDYLNSYADLGLNDYMLAKKFLLKYKIPMNTALQLLSGEAVSSGGGCRSSVESFKGGTFKVKDYLKASILATKIVAVGDFYDGNKRQCFMSAIVFISRNPAFNFNKFLKKLAIQRTALVHCATHKQYIMLIEDIYNYRSREKVRFI
jgi:hypothetical protein